MSDKIKVTTNRGVTIEGTVAEVLATLTKLGATLLESDVFHYSSTQKKLVRIADMHPTHIRNAITKIYRAWLDKVSKFEGLEYIKALQNGPNDPVLLNLLKELNNQSAKI